MSPRAFRSSGFLVWLSLLAVVASTSCRSKRPRARTAVARPSPPPAMENALGIVAGPRDETAFEFELERATEGDQKPVIEGVPELAPELIAALTPYLEARRTRVASVRAAGPSLVVLTRLDSVTQAYEIATPGATPVALTAGADPVAQVAVVAGPPAQLILRRDRDGDEQYQLYRRRLDSPGEQLLSDGSSRHGVFTISRDARQLAFTNNARHRRDLDVYRAPTTGPFTARRLLARDGQWVAGAWSPDGARLLVRNYRSADSSSLFLVDAATGTASQLSLGAGEVVMRDGRFAPDGRSVFVVSDAGGEFAQLHSIDLASGAVRTLTADIPWDVELVAVSPQGAELAVVVNQDGQSALYVCALDGSSPRRIDLPAGVVSSVSYVGRSGWLALTLATATEPADAYTLRIDTGELVRWSESESTELDRRPMVDPVLVRFASFDGVSVPAYYYRPPGEGPFPVLLWVHGGPEAQHRPSFDPLLQYFVVERGYAVVAPNIRGSSGYGRTYLALDDGTKRLDAVRDIGATLDWIATRSELDPTRVGIYGASYGGYVVLASMVEFGDRLAAGCDLVGISDIVTFLENTSAYRRDVRRAEYGDERDAAVREVLTRISPLTSAERIRTPLLVGHGANDPRVPASEAQQIVEAVRRNGVDVGYILARDEGHGFRKRKSRDLFYAAMVEFFARHLTPPRKVAPDAPDGGPAAGPDGG